MRPPLSAAADTLNIGSTAIDIPMTPQYLQMQIDGLPRGGDPTPTMSTRFSATTPPRLGVRLSTHPHPSHKPSNREIPLTTALRPPPPTKGNPAPPGAAKRRRSTGDRITLGRAAPILFAVAALIAVVIALGDRSATTQVPVATRAIPAGSPVNASNTHLAPVHNSDSAVISGLLPAAALNQGWVAAGPINPGDAITRSEVVHPAAGAGVGAMSIAVAPSHADGGAIVTGDTVDVIAQPNANTQGATAVGPQYIAQGLKVLNVAPTNTSGGVLAASNSDYYIVVAVDRTTALRLATALAAGGSSTSASAVQVIRTTGEAGS
jgi:Flp pilus assembly protein CpaB